MTIQEFTNSVDGIINDYLNGISDETEFRDNITDLLISIATPVLAQDTDEDFNNICAALAEKAENALLFRKALLRVTAQIIHDLHRENYEDTAETILSILQTEF